MIPVNEKAILEECENWLMTIEADFWGNGNPSRSDVVSLKQFIERMMRKYQ